MLHITLPSQKRDIVTSLTPQNVRINSVCPLSLCLCWSRSSHRSLTVLPLQVILCKFSPLHACRLVADKTLWCREHDYSTSVSACAKDHFTTTLQKPDFVVAAVVLLNTQRLSFLIPSIRVFQRGSSIPELSHDQKYSTVTLNEIQDLSNSQLIFKIVSFWLSCYVSLYHHR